MNWEIFGHEWAVNLLKENVARGEVRHAYLFNGPQGIGRRTLALRLAQALNCPQPSAPGEPCRICRTCMQIERMQHPDLAVIQSEQEGGVLKVDQIRELQRSLALHPYEARYRVAVLLRFEEANLSAMNALLKTLEEPAPQVVLILTAENSESLIPTIFSRCEVLRLNPLPFEQVSQWLHIRWKLPLEQAQLLAHISFGRPGYALRMFQEPYRLEQRHAWLDEQTRLLSANRVERFAYADSLAKDKEVLRSLLLLWLSYWRDVLLKSKRASAPLVNLDRTNEIEFLAARFDSRIAYQTVTALKHVLILLERNINPRLAVEVLMLDLPYLKEKQVT